MWYATDDSAKLWFSNAQNPDAVGAVQFRPVGIGEAEFRAIRARLLEGRLFDTSDDEEARKVIVGDETLARRTWPGESALGKRLLIELWGGQGLV